VERVVAAGDRQPDDRHRGGDLTSRPRRRWVRRLGLAGLGLVGVVGVVALGGYGWLRSPWGQEWLRGQAEAALDGLLTEGSAEIGGLSTNLWGRASVRDLRLRDAAGRPVIAVDEAEVRLRPAGILRWAVVIDEVRAEGVIVDLRKDDAGTYEIARMFSPSTPAPPSTAPWEGLPIRVEAPAIVVRAPEVSVMLPTDDVLLRDVALDAGFFGEGRRLEVRDLALTADVASPGRGPLRLTGGAIWEGLGLADVALDVAAWRSSATLRGRAPDLLGPAGEVDLRLELPALALEDVDRFVGAGLAGSVGGALTAKGPVGAVAVDGRLAGSPGTDLDLGVDATVDATSGRFDGGLDVASLRLDHLIPTVGGPFPLAGRLRVDGGPDDSDFGFGARGRLDEGRVEVLGVALDRVASGLTLEDGTLVFTDLDAAGPAGTVGGGGTFDLRTGVIDLDLALADVDPAALRSLQVPAELDGTRARGDVKVRVDAFDPAVPVGVVGRVVAAPLRWGPDVRVARADATLDVNVRGAVVTVGGGGALSGIDAYGAVIEAGRVDGLTVRVDEVGTTLAFDVAGRDLRYDLVPDPLAAELGRSVTLDVFEGPVSIGVPFAEDAPLRVDARFDVGPNALLRFPGEAGSIVVGLEGDALTVVAALDAADRKLLDTWITLDLASMDLGVERLEVAPLPGQTWIARPDGRLTLTPEGGVAGASLTLASSRGRLTVTGDAGGTGAQDLLLDVYDLDLGAVAELLPVTAGGLSGYAGASLRLGGQADALTLTGPVEVADVAWATRGEDGVTTAWVHDLGARLQVDARGQRLGLEGVLLGRDRPLVAVNLRAPVILDLARLGPDPHGPLDGELRLIPGRFDRFEAVLGDTVLPAGAASGRLVAGGTLVRPELRWAGVAELPVEGLDRELRVETFVTLAEGRLRTEIDAREGAALRAEVRAGGTTRVAEVLDWALLGGPEPDLADLDLWLSALYGGIGLREVPIRRLAALGGVTLDGDGDISGDVVLAGSLLAPRPAGRLFVERGRLGGVTIPNADLDLRADDDGFTVALDVGLVDEKAGIDGEIYVDGRVPVAVDLREPAAAWVRGPLDLRATAEVPLTILSAFDPGFSELAGALLVNGTIQGDPLDPSPSAALTLSRGSALGYAPLGVRFDELDLQASFDRRGVSIARLSTITSPIDPARGGLGVFGTVGQEVGRGVGRLGRRGRAAAEDVGLVAVQGGREVQLRRGEVRASGTATLERWSVSALDLSASLDRAVLLGNPDQVLRLSTAGDAPLRITGDLGFPKVEGAVRVDEAYFFLDYATAVGGASLALDPRITVHRAGRTFAAPPPEASVLDDVAVSVRIDLGRAARGRLSMPLESMAFLGQATTALTKVDLAARLGGDLVFRQVPCRARGADGVVALVPGRAGACGLFHPQIEGVVNVLEGTARVFRADFTLEDSTVSFFGAEVYDPNLDVKGKMKTGDVTIDMTIGGSALAPDVAFTSADTDQVFATLLLGTPPDDLGSQGASQLAFAAAMTAFQSVLSGANLGTFSIEPNGQIAWGLAVARDLYVEGTIGGTPRPDQNTLEVQAEYTVAPGLIGRVGFGAYAIPFWLDVLLERRFD
jgi:hypothetical protein